MQTAIKGERMLTNTSCNLQRNIETSKIKNVSWSRWKMQMRKQNNYQEMLYQHLKLQLLKNARIATKEFVKMLSKRLGTQNKLLLTCLMCITFGNLYP